MRDKQDATKHAVPPPPPPDEAVLLPEEKNVPTPPQDNSNQQEGRDAVESRFAGPRPSGNLRAEPSVTRKKLQQHPHVYGVDTTRRKAPKPATENRAKHIDT